MIDVPYCITLRSCYTICCFNDTDGGLQHFFQNFDIPCTYTSARQQIYSVKNDSCFIFAIIRC
jgi:hypothetical protein